MQEGEVTFGHRLWCQGICNHSSLTSDNIYDHVRDGPWGLALLRRLREEGDTGPPQGHHRATGPSPRVWGLPTWPPSRRVKSMTLQRGYGLRPLVVAGVVAGSA